MHNEIKYTCATCKHCNKGQCENNGMYLEGYYWTCDSYTHAGVCQQSLINASWAYIDMVSTLKRTLDWQKSRIDKLSASIPSQQLSELVKSSQTNRAADNVMELMEAKEQYEQTKQEFDIAIKHFHKNTRAKQNDDIVILLNYYIYGRPAKEVSEEIGVGLRQFYNRCNDALFHIYDVIDLEYRRLVR